MHDTRMTSAAWHKSSYSNGAHNCTEVATATAWRKSSYSQGNNNCVEVATTMTWHKSSYSQGASNCVEVAAGPGIAVRDSKNPTGPALVVYAASWRRFVAGVHRA